MPYCKTTKSTIEKGKELGQRMDPEEILNELTDPNCKQTSMKGPNTARYCRNVALQKQNGPAPKRNIADMWVETFQQIQDKVKFPFVRTSWLDDETGKPCIMLYSDNQISDMKNLCGSESYPSTVFGVRFLLY